MKVLTNAIEEEEDSLRSINISQVSATCCIESLSKSLLNAKINTRFLDIPLDPVRANLLIGNNKFCRTGGVTIDCSIHEQSRRSEFNGIKQIFLLFRFSTT